MKTRKVVILGSSRGDGETRQKVDALKTLLHCEIIDLQEYRISFYDYQNTNHDDDFVGLMKNIIEGYDALIFATPGGLTRNRSGDYDLSQGEVGNSNIRHFTRLRTLSSDYS
ncbi:NAD(P)H-dependent oxidoreductase [Aggregatimonas sangjinii]|uniref:NAD(P)H-dependent oxidoreductase n=1 Tax=Aggregatimonas sangjinii TaxID=2583587 RepID=A0A5B7STR0_9FLAO|nr:NAD(P)H-dependent oxidoreductase [Aggregatimonas sangjinii]QCX01996.1 NAD(P)H-dependent oxidoreductase [Aggregatimonas sangjinii]